MEGITKLYHGVPAVLIDGQWIILSAGFNEIATMPEEEIDNQEFFRELEKDGFFDYATMLANTFQLTLITTSDCNLRCRYCFANSGDSANIMPENVAFASIDHALSVSAGRRLSVAFFGGEPSLTAKLIKRVVEYARRRVQQAPDVRGVEFSITTNGVMSSSFLDFLIANDFQITLSSDGPAEIQDFQRPRKTGGPSSGSVEKTIKGLVKRGKKFKVRVTVTDFSVSKMVDVVEWIYRLGGKAIHFEPVTISGRATKGHGLEKPSVGSFVNNLQRAIMRGNELGVGIVNSSFMNISTPPPEFCEGKANNRISVSYTGDVTTCVEVQEKCHPASSSFIIGRYDQKMKRIVLEREQRVRLCSGTKMTECVECFASKSCGGGCPIRNFHVTGTTTEVDPYRCEMIKQMLPFLMTLLLQSSIKGAV
jgi:uncharacterized protein